MEGDGWTAPGGSGGTPGGVCARAHECVGLYDNYNDIDSSQISSHLNI